VREEAYGEVAAEAYFGGLLPESDAVKEIIGKRYGISHNNNFALLKAIGYDCAGAVSFHGTTDPVVLQNAIPLAAKIIAPNELYKHIKELPRKPLFMDVDGLRLSLAGVQDKAAVCVVDNAIALAENGCPTTHILKPSAQHFPGMAENEYFCLRLATLMGLPIPAIKLLSIKDISFLLIERYDRRTKNQYIERIHQEDFCQALGKLSSRKYQNEGGPGFKDCFQLLKDTAQPAVDRNLMALALVFNYLIGNMDAHGKNFSLLHIDRDIIRLAPLYDLVCTRVYSGLTTKMAMKIGSKYEADKLFPRYWEELCKDINYRYLSMKALLINTAEKLLSVADAEMNLMKSQGHEVGVVEQIVGVIKRNAESISEQFK
jgi:serine/threonine-protein kinase HipA